MKFGVVEILALAIGANVVLISLIKSIADRFDKDKELRPAIRKAQRDRWLSGRCLPLAGRFCGCCGKAGECWEQCRKQLMHKIDKTNQKGE